MTTWNVNRKGLSKLNYAVLVAVGRGDEPYTMSGCLVSDIEEIICNDDLMVPGTYKHVDVLNAVVALQSYGFLSSDGERVVRARVLITAKGLAAVLNHESL